METPIRHRLRSAAKQGCVASDDDSGRNKPTISTAQLGGSEPSSLRRVTQPMSQCDGSTISLAGMFGGEEEERAEMEVPAAKTDQHERFRFTTTEEREESSTVMTTSVEEMLAMGSRLLQMSSDGCGGELMEVSESSQAKEQSGLRMERNAHHFNEPVPQKYSWTGRSKYAAPGVMEDRLPLNPSIPEHMVEDDVGVWVTFDVPAGHHLYGTFVPVDRNLLPDDIPIQRLVGNVFGQATKPTMDQIRAAVDAAQ